MISTWRGRTSPVLPETPLLYVMSEMLRPRKPVDPSRWRTHLQITETRPDGRRSILLELNGDSPAASFSAITASGSCTGRLDVARYHCTSARSRRSRSVHPGT